LQPGEILIQLDLQRIAMARVNGLYYGPNVQITSFISEVMIEPYLNRVALWRPSVGNAMDDLNTVGDYSENGCPPYQKAVEFGEAALALLQGSTVTIEGHARSYPTQPIKKDLQPRLKRIRDKVEACCKKRP
jgi:hypothetical protein